MGLLYFLIVGLVAGWLAGQIMKGGSFGLLGNLIIGVIGALLGGFVFAELGIFAGGLIGSIICATLGAMLLLFLLKVIDKRR